MSASPDRDRLRVLQVTPRMPPSIGGVETHVMEVAKRLPSLGVETAVATADATRLLPPATKVEGVHITRVPAWPTGRDYYVAPALRREIRPDHWDVVHVQSYHTAFAPLAMAAALRAGIPFVVTFHGGGSSSDLRNALRSTQIRTLRPLLRRAAARIAIADFEIARYGPLLGLGPEHFTKVPNGADLPVPATLATAAGGTRLISIGRLERYKGHHLALRALPGVIETYPDARLWIAGDGPDEAYLRAEAQRLGVADRVDIGAATRDVLAERLAGASLVVLLSSFESHPLVALEALSAGAPLLVGRDGAGLSELAAAAGVRSVDLSASTDDHAQAMIAEITSPTPITLPPVQTWDDCAAQLAEVYRSVAT